MEKRLLLILRQRRYMKIYRYSSFPSGKAFGGCSWQLSVLINSSKMHSVHSEGRNSAAIIMRRVAITNTLHIIKKRKHKYWVIVTLIKSAKRTSVREFPTRDHRRRVLYKIGECSESLDFSFAHLFKISTPLIASISNYTFTCWPWNVHLPCQKCSYDKSV